MMADVMMPADGLAPYTMPALCNLASGRAADIVVFRRQVPMNRDVYPIIFFRYGIPQQDPDPRLL